MPRRSKKGYGLKSRTAEVEPFSTGVSLLRGAPEAPDIHRVVDGTV
jgi:hypothetical protein